MNKILFISLVLLFQFLSSFGYAKKPIVPPQAAQSCVACHGVGGRSNNPLWPNLAGQKKDYLLKQLNDFRAGHRQDPLMGPMSKTLDEEDLAPLAEYFSSLD